MENVGISRIVPNIASADMEGSKSFYMGFLGMELAMDMGWILTFASKENPASQISILGRDEKTVPGNEAVFLSVEVSDVDFLYERAVEMSIEITYPITDEAWGVRRFFVKDPNGATLNILAHPGH